MTPRTPAIDEAAAQRRSASASSAARGIERQFDPPPFHLHTIPKIGFRLDSAEPRRAGRAEPPPLDISPLASVAAEVRNIPRRRVLIGAAGVALLAGVGGAWWLETRRLQAPARAAMEAGMAAFRQSTPDQMTQAIAAFQARHGPAPNTWILWMPPLAAMRADPRMLPVIRAVGLADY